MATADHLGRRERARCIDRKNRPTLALLVAVEDPPWAPELAPEHAHYPLFRWALDHQDDWGRDAHAGFWRAALALWPRTRGNRRHRGLLSRWVDRWQRFGYADAEIEVALGYEPGSLERMGVLSEARTYRHWVEDGKVRMRKRLEPLGPPGFRPRVVPADQHQFEEWFEGLSYDALPPADLRRRAATHELVQRAEARLTSHSPWIG